MTNEEFSALVRDMRTAQNEYFKTRSKDALNKSKRLERQVDEALHKHYNQDTQQSMFDLEQGTPSYVTLDKTPPDPALGRYKTFESEQVIAYVQVLDNKEVYFKTVTKVTGQVQTTTYTGTGAEDLLKYIVDRCREIAEKTTGV